MGLFGKWRQRERTPAQEEPALTEKINDAEKEMVAIRARQTFLEVLTLLLVTELPPKKREALMEKLQERVRGLIVMPPPAYIPPHRQDDFHEELRRIMQVFIERTPGQKPTV